MSFSQDRKYEHQSFDVGAMRKAFSKTRDLLDGDNAHMIKASYRFGDDVAHEKQLSLEELDLITNLSPPLKTLSFCFYEDLEIKILVIFNFSFNPIDFEISVQAASLDLCKDVQKIFKNELALLEAKEGQVESVSKSPHQVLIPSLESHAQKKELEHPEKVTIKWLYHNVSYSVWGWLLGSLAAAFAAGVAFTETPLYEALKSPSQEESSSK